VLAEGWREAALPRVEVHRRAVAREWLCATDRRVFAVVTDEPPPRRVRAFDADDVDGLAGLLVERFGLKPGAKARPRARSKARPKG
jgi:molybdopterin-guanine dinucleotide biosynthesis protein B